MIVYSDLGIGGVQRKIVDIVNRLHELPQYRSYTVTILLERVGANTMIMNLRNPNVTIHVKPFVFIPFWMHIAYFALITDSVCILSFLAFPAVHVFKATRVLFWKKFRVIHSEDVITSHAYRRNDFTGKINSQIHDALSRGDQIIVPSRPIAEDLIRSYHIDRKRITLIPNWTTISSSQAKERHKTIDCVYVGRFDKEKRLPLLISAIRHISRVSLISCVLIGDGKEKSKIQSMIHALHLHQRVHIHRPTMRIVTELQRARLALYASQSEGVPMFFLEAMAMGLPIVTMDFPGVKDIVKHGKTGYVCTSERQLAEKIQTLLQNNHLRKSMGAYGQRVARVRYTAANIDRYLAEMFIPARP